MTATSTDHHDQKPALLLILEGVMVYGQGEAACTMRPGDALQLDAEGAHGPRNPSNSPSGRHAVRQNRDPSRV